MRNRVIVVLLIILLFISLQIRAADFSYKAMFESYLEDYREDGEEYFTSLNEFNLKIDTGTFNYTLHLDGSVLFNDKGFKDLNELSIKCKSKLNKLFLNCWFTEGQLKFGKQRIAWGSGYFFNPTDLINPLKEDDKGEINPRDATEGVYGRYYIGAATLEAVVITDFQPLGPDTDKEAANLAQQYNPLLTGEVDLPENFSEERELAVRYSTLINMFDFSLLYYQGREDYPVVELNPASAKLLLKHPRKDVIGINLSGTVGDIAVWSEASYSNPEIGDNYLQSIIGMDYTFENGIHLLGEYYYDNSFSNFVSDQEVDIKDFICLEADYNLTDLIKIEADYLTPINSDYYQIYGKLTYPIRQNLELETGFNKSGNKEGTIFENNSFFSIKDKIYFKIKYYF
ncbi:hypothetical protein GM661_09445 [Iocasia frigidifontis]|uniref:Uncharacterized protein n=1 Tax=Iocasia fonsfrigidae TaxID=2682810 RepID=A0A8A7KH22_9FIRM|nr:hypothetical protein [Iocasia fonsfrigidae]QTL98187.1 hypothetical protein GM661_09445 [Iocasia fonsfrigidae]